jgi:hypothetical protein
MGEVVQLFNKTRVTAKCLLCGDTDACLVDTDSWNWYISSRSRLVQDLFPNEDTWTREILIGNRTGAYMCVECCTEEE